MIPEYWCFSTIFRIMLSIYGYYVCVDGGTEADIPHFEWMIPAGKACNEPSVYKKIT